MRNVNRRHRQHHVDCWHHRYAESGRLFGIEVGSNAWAALAHELFRFGVA
jgi:hypothetical protein